MWPNRYVIDDIFVQEYQGNCPYCDHVFLRFLKWEREKKDFKDLIKIIEYEKPGNSMTNRIFIFLCPECHEKSGFHGSEYCEKEWGHLFPKDLRRKKK